MPPIPPDQRPGAIKPDRTRRPYGGSSRSSSSPAIASPPRAGRTLHRDHRHARGGGDDDDGAVPAPWTLAPEDDRFLNSKQVRERYAGASEDEFGFPRPLDISGRRFWRLSSLIAWERSRATKALRSGEAADA